MHEMCYVFNHMCYTVDLWNTTYIGHSYVTQILYASEYSIWEKTQTRSVSLHIPLIIFRIRLALKQKVMMRTILCPQNTVFYINCFEGVQTHAWDKKNKK